MALKAGRYGLKKKMLEKLLSLPGIKSIGDGLYLNASTGELSATGGGGGTTVVANPEGTATSDLNKLQVGEDIYGIPEGTGVVANPEGTATDDLEKLQVGEAIYAIPVADTSKCYKTTDDTEADIVDADYIPFLDSSATPGQSDPKKSTWSNFCNKIAAKLATVFNADLGISSIGAGLIVNGGELSASAVGVNYSTSEQNTGIKWIDGKPVYQKTIDCGALPNNTEKIVAFNISDLKRIINLYGYAWRPTGNVRFMTLPYSTQNGSDQVQVDYNSASGAGLRIKTMSDMSAFTESYVTMLYTKTTD